MEKKPSKDLEPSTALRRQWNTCTEWNAGAGLAVDFSTTTAFYGPRKDKGNPGCISFDPKQLTGKRKEALTSTRSSDGLEGLPRQWKGPLGNGPPTRPGRAVDEPILGDGGGDWLRSPVGPAKSLRDSMRGIESAGRKKNAKEIIPKERVTEAMKPIEAYRTGARGGARLSFKPPLRKK
jgi:hypothetical protein